VRQAPNALRPASDRLGGVLKDRLYRKRKNPRHDFKKCYDTEHDAKAAAAMAELAYGRKQNAYLCGCGKWHTGTAKEAMRS
jgi:hypothetical protein